MWGNNNVRKRNRSERNYENFGIWALDESSEPYGYIFQDLRCNAIDQSKQKPRYEVQHASWLLYRQGCCFSKRILFIARGRQVDTVW